MTFLSGCHEIATIDLPGLPDSQTASHSAGYKLGDDFEPFTTTIALFMVFFRGLMDKDAKGEECGCICK